MILVVIVYFFAGIASQKLVPGVDEVIPFFGWSLFSRVPAEERAYSLVITVHRAEALEPPVSWLAAPPSMVRGNRYVGRKVIQHLGRAIERGNAAEVEDQRRLLEGSYLRGVSRYEVVVERFEPLERWRTGDSRERRVLAQFTVGEGS